VIQDALGKLAKDFHRFDERMNALARHIEQASRDVQDVQTSSRKISAHFQKIESARLDELDDDSLAVAATRSAGGRERMAGSGG
jgi:DNA recombination protein RmuC